MYIYITKTILIFFPKPLRVNEVFSMPIIIDPIDNRRLNEKKNQDFQSRRKIINNVRVINSSRGNLCTSRRYR